MGSIELSIGSWYVVAVRNNRWRWRDFDPKESSSSNCAIIDFSTPFFLKTEFRNEGRFESGSTPLFDFTIFLLRFYAIEDISQLHSFPINIRVINFLDRRKSYEFFQKFWFNRIIRFFEKPWKHLRILLNFDFIFLSIKRFWGFNT